MSTLGVVIPTKNSLAYLPRHLESMADWLDLASEVVVVDSYSPDGTLDYLRANLRHPNLRFCSHPPGLYACWNHGFAQISADYSYLSTIGDLITRAGLQRLLQAAEALRCDVVISKPTFYGADGQPLPDIAWPIDDMVRTLGITQPRLLHKLETVVFALTNLTGALTGSSASNLFRAQVLHRHPFPTNFGTMGDGAWGIMHAADLSWGVVPERFSRFLKHPTAASSEERARAETAPRFDQVAREMIAAAQQAGTLTAAELDRLRVEALLDATSAYLDAKSAFDCLRKSKAPWILQPLAWQARAARHRAASRIQALKLETLKAITREPQGS